jgi:arylsulfatase A-like enzyme
VLIVTDDQGYGDLSAHDNQIIKTPHLDRLYAQSVRLRDFHVNPTCSPTRAALMTGQYPTKAGVWHTIAGRSLMSKEEVTIAEVLRAAGYHTGIFGKWHLGDNYPFRPQDQGFQRVVVLGGGGIGQTPDYWGNDHIDDHYRAGGRLRSFSGYSTDVFFDQALEFIKENRDRPFLPIFQPVWLTVRGRFLLPTCDLILRKTLRGTWPASTGCSRSSMRT